MNTLFTPCVVIGGLPWRSWANLATLPTFNRSPGTLKVETQGPGRYRVIFNPTDKLARNYEAHMALLGFDIDSIPAKGENAGRKLKHDFVALEYEHTSMEGTSAPSAALNLNTQDSRAKKTGVAAWVTQSGNPVAIQATGGYLD